MTQPTTKTPGAASAASAPIGDSHRRPFAGEDSPPPAAPARTAWLTVRSARHNNLKNVDAHLPLGRFVCITGVSGSGKSSLVNDILHEALAAELNGAITTPGEFELIEVVGGAPPAATGLKVAVSRGESRLSESRALQDAETHAGRRRGAAGAAGSPARIAPSVRENLDKIIAIDQSPIGRTPRSNPATYIKVFDEIRDLFTKLPDSKLRGYKPGRFSFNVSAGRKGGGRCEGCEGNGANRIEMDFLADVWVTCPLCEGKRFGRETLAIQYKGKSIADVLEMDVQQALEHFENVPRIRGMLQTLHDVGLDYIGLGQPSTTLSGGEAQRIKLARELVKKPTGRTVYVLDEPTTGLHFEDIRKLLVVLHGFVDAGNTVLVIEHNLDVVKTADWVIDLGPEGGEAGGRIVAAGTPEEVAANPASYTGQALAEVLRNAAENAECRTRNAETPPADALRRDEPPPTESSATSARIGHSPSTVDHSASQSRAPSDAAAAALGIDHSAFPMVRVVGAQQNNLRDLTVEFPRDRTTVVTGVSGSGKTSFAIDTVFAEGYRRYVESLSAYARQFLGQMTKPRVEHVEGLSPAICIEQKAASKSPRSTVGTITEIYDYMRVLWARVGTPYCPRCNVPVGTQTVDEIVDRAMALPPSTPVVILAPVALGDGESYANLFNRLKNSGYTRVRIDGEIVPTAHATTLDVRRKHRVEVVVDRTIIRPKGRGRISESIEHALALGNGVMTLVVEAVELVEEQATDAKLEGLETREHDGTGGKVEASSDNALAAAPPLFVPPSLPSETMFSQRLACLQCGSSYEELGPHHFSFNSQMGWCETCEGLGVQRGAPAAEIIKNPRKHLFNGAIAGWPFLRAEAPLGRLLKSLCRRLGLAADTPLEQWTGEQKQQLLYGTSGDWIDASDAFDGVRMHWRGFFPAIDNATRNSWTLRHRLHNVVTDIPCLSCRGGRLRPDAAAVRLGGETIVALTQRPLHECQRFFEELTLDAAQRRVAGELLHEIRARLQFLIDVGLDYLSLHRAAPTLSGGEAQRIRLASQIGSGLSGVLYVLDEPTIGLHPRDTRRLTDALRKLRDLGNTLLMVEHDRDVIRSADRLLDFGPGAGRFGGQLVARGTPQSFIDSPPPGADGPPESLTQAYLSGRAAVAVPANRRPVDAWRDSAPALAGAGTAAKARGKSAARAATTKRPSRRDPLPAASPDLWHGRWLVLRGVRHNNLKDLTVPIPLGRFVCVTGVSGSGKSSLVNDVLWPALASRTQLANLVPGEHDALDGLEHIDKVINVDQSPIGVTPASNPATYTGVFDWIRELYVRLPESKLRGYDAKRFSFNRPGGRCEACEGNGQKRIEMHFMADVWITCETCGGMRYTPETLQVRFKGKTIADVLEMQVGDALGLFANVPKIRRMLKTLSDVGLDYVQLGQPAPTLSGGEAQRVKLAAELGKPDTGRTLYILDEPTTGLHFDDVRKLLEVMHRLVDLGNSVIVVEHNLDVIKSSDWVIELGPEAGEAGGRIVATGTPEALVDAECKMRNAAENAEFAAASKKRQLKGNAAEPDTDDSSLTIDHSARSTNRRTEAGAATSAKESSSTFGIATFSASHTGAALAPILAAGPCETRSRYDPSEHAASEIADEKAGLGKIGREVKLPWQVDGRRWHLEQRTSRDATSRRWEPGALLFVEELVHAAGEFEPTNWNDRASVEFTAPGAPCWFLHALTGGEWLLELYFRVPRGSFDGPALNRQLKLKTLDQREDLQVYGDWPRVDVRERQCDYDAVVIYVHDKAEIDTPAFRKFIKQAVKAYRTWCG